MTRTTAARAETFLRSVVVKQHPVYETDRPLANGITERRRAQCDRPRRRRRWAPRFCRCWASYASYEETLFDLRCFTRAAASSSLATCSRP
jgi:hypothetical protein